MTGRILTLVPLRTLLLFAPISFQAEKGARSGDHWPSFRGANASGVADSYDRTQSRLVAVATK